MNAHQRTTAVQPPMSIAAKNIRYVSRFTTPDGQRKGEIWTADIKARRHGSQAVVFLEIIFIEYNGIASIYGIDMDDGYPSNGGFVPKDAALKQQKFIHFLREATAQDCNTLGMLSFLFSGHEYSNEGKATAAYIVARGAPLAMGLGYWTATEGYQTNAFDPEPEGWLETALGTKPFDKL